VNPEPTEPAVPVVWRKGWFYPAVTAPACLILGVLVVVFGGIEIAGVIPGVIVLGCLFVAVGVGAAGTAFRRKLTLTEDTVVVRNLFRTRTVALAEITEVRRGLGDNGLFAIKPVWISAGQKSVSTKSFGTHQTDGIALLARAAIARGAQVYGWNAERELAHPEEQ
jgi:hypothetical protein